MGEFYQTPLYGLGTSKGSIIPPSSGPGGSYYLATDGGLGPYLDLVVLDLGRNAN